MWRGGEERTGGGAVAVPEPGAGQERCGVDSHLGPFHNLRHCLSRRTQASRLEVDRGIEQGGNQEMPLTNQGGASLTPLTPRPLHNVSLVGPLSVQNLISCYHCRSQSQPDCRPY